MYIHVLHTWTSKLHSDVNVVFSMFSYKELFIFFYFLFFIFFLESIYVHLRVHGP